jgi:FMN phosphatase YigB (HAD superfamily)
VVRVLLFDLGGTLVDAERPLPHVTDALTALNELDGSTGEPLQTALISDFPAGIPATQDGVEASFAEYLAILDRTGLRRFFEPVERRVTLSAHAGVRKPDRRVYELALARLGSDATLADCLVITEDGGHVEACRRLGMLALQFGADFDDWVQAPELVRRLVDPADAESALFERSLRAHGQLGADGGTPTAGATHCVERDEDGGTVIRRERFNSL